MASLPPEATTTGRADVGASVCAETTRRTKSATGASRPTTDNPLCRSCRLTRVIPDLSVPAHVTTWHRLEAAKRRLIVSLLALQLPIVDRTQDPNGGLAFDFKADPDDPDGPPVMTGHAAGVITINIAEADDAERERRRQSMREPYRTLVGHMRHESGHYFWDRLIRGHAGARGLSPALWRRTTRLRRRAGGALRRWAARQLVLPVRQRLRQFPPLGRLGRDVGALPPHDGHPRDRGR